MKRVLRFVGCVPKEEDVPLEIGKLLAIFEGYGRADQSDAQELSRLAQEHGDAELFDRTQRAIFHFYTRAA